MEIRCEDVRAATLAVMSMPVLHGDRLTLRPLRDVDLDGLVAIVAEPGVREWWGPADDEERLRADFRNDGNAFAIEVDGALAGWLGITEEAEPGYGHAGLDIALSSGYQGRGLGPEALRTVIRWLVGTRGHHRFTIDPALANHRAIRAYSSVGFRRVGVLRRYERGADGVWHDNLLMDLLADELQEPAEVPRPAERPD
jgi:aminoglycoside 6'-N-acetyltransferase